VSEQPHHKQAAPPTDNLQTEPQQSHQQNETHQSQNIDSDNSSTVMHTQTNNTHDPQSLETPIPSLLLTPAERLVVSQSFSFNLSTAVEMSMQLDTDPNFINNIQMASAAAAEEGAGLTQLEEPVESQQSLRIKEDIPIDLRVKLIVSMIHLEMIPNEVNYMHK